jgi:hypothetical protein
VKQKVTETAGRILAERQSTHGNFSENARVMQGVKRVLRTGDNWLRFLQGTPDGLVDVQAEAIEMICVKLGRIVTGDPNEADHWADIEGYARLARDRLAKG